MRVLPIIVAASIIILGVTAFLVVQGDFDDSMQREDIQASSDETELVPVDWFIVTLEQKPSTRDPVTHTGFLMHIRCSMYGTGSFDPCGFRTNSSVEKIEFEFEWSGDTYDTVFESRFGVEHEKTGEVFEVGNGQNFTVTRDNIDGSLAGSWELFAGPAGVYESFYTAVQVTVWAESNVTEPAPEWVVGTYEQSATSSWCSNDCSFTWTKENVGKGVLSPPGVDSLELIFQNADTGDEVTMTEWGTFNVTPGEWVITPRTTEPVIDPAQQESDLWVVHVTPRKPS